MFKEPLQVALLAIALLAGVILALLLWIRPRLRGTTLMAACYWSVVAILVVAGTEVVVATLGGENAPAWAAPLRYAAAMSTFCPIMAVLGAKRPQDKAWQWIVLAMWVTLCTPCFQWLAFGQGAPFAVHGAWKIFVYGLMGVTLLNYVPIRPRSAGILAVGGQCILLRPYLIEVTDSLVPQSLLVFMFATLWAAFIVIVPEHELRALTDDDSLTRINIRWRSFQNIYGSFWALRVQRRINQTAEAGNWPVRLEWDGFAAAEGEGPPELSAAQLAEIQRCLQSMLSRFVSEASDAER